MEINNLLREAFLTEWNRLSYKNVTPYLTLISENFEVEGNLKCLFFIKKNC